MGTGVEEGKPVFDDGWKKPNAKSQCWAVPPDKAKVRIVRWPALAEPAGQWNPLIRRVGPVFLVAENERIRSTTTRGGW